MFIRNVKTSANLLGHWYDSIPNLIKACMPTKIYGNLYSINILADIINMVRHIYAMKLDTSKTRAMTSTTPFRTIQSKSATQPSFHLASAPFPGFLNGDFYRYYDNNRFNTEDLGPINHTLQEAEVGVAIPIINKATSIEVIIDIKVEGDFLQIEAISDPEVVED